MTVFKIDIKEKQKFIRKLNFPKLNAEIYNFMYKKTILEQSRDSLSFYILLYFLILKDKKWNSLLYSIFSDNLDKVEKLNKEFSKKEWNLKAWEYSEIKEKEWLTNLFKNDIFFHLVKTFFNLPKIYIEYNDFLKDHSYIKEELQKIDTTFSKKINKIYYEFYDHKIEDDREDDEWNTLDLSKSIFHTINMRMSRKLDLALSLNTDIKSIKSSSPIDVTLLQTIDPTIIINIWNKYNLFDYTNQMWWYVSNNPLLSSTVWWILWQIVFKKLEYNKTDWRKDKKKRKELEKDIEKLNKKFEENSKTQTLLVTIINQIVNTQDNLDWRIEKIEENIIKLEKDKTNNNNQEILQLQDDVKKLKNLDVKTTIYNIQWNVWQLQNNSENSIQNNNS